MELYALTYNTWADVLANNISSQTFTPLDINPIFSTGGFGALAFPTSEPPKSVPEPSTLVLFVLGLGWLAATLHRMRRPAKIRACQARHPAAGRESFDHEAFLATAREPCPCVALALLAALSACSKQEPAAQAPAAEQTAPAAEDLLAASVNSDSRSAEDKSRDQYRHPQEALAFWGLQPGMTILEVQPGGGWWTEILAPYARATGGKYYATAADLDNPELSEGSRKARAEFEARFAAKPEVYGQVQLVNFGAEVQAAAGEHVRLRTVGALGARLDGLTASPRRCSRICTARSSPAAFSRSSSIARIPASRIRRRRAAMSPRRT